MRCIVGSLGFLSLFLIAGCSNLVRSSDAYAITTPWADYEKVVVRGTNGPVDLAPGTGPAVDVTGEKWAHGVTPEEADQNQKQVHVTAAPDPANPRQLLIQCEFPESIRGRSPGASMVIRMPKAVAADIKTSNGAVRIEKWSATTVRTSNGDVNVTDIAGPVNLHSSNGSIEAARISGEMKIHTSNGAVVVHEAGAAVDAETSNGRIDVELASSANCGAMLRSSNGAVRLCIPKALAAAVDLDTSNGSATVEGAAIQIAKHDRSSLSGTVNGGGANRIVLRSSNGSVTIVAR